MCLRTANYRLRKLTTIAILTARINVTDFDDVNEGDGGLVVLPGSRTFSFRAPLRNLAQDLARAISTCHLPLLCRVGRLAGMCR